MRYKYENCCFFQRAQGVQHTMAEEKLYAFLQPLDPEQYGKEQEYQIVKEGEEQGENFYITGTFITHFPRSSHFSLLPMVKNYWEVIFITPLFPMA